jgi:hypothetical protein
MCRNSEYRLGGYEYEYFMLGNFHTSSPKINKKVKRRRKAIFEGFRHLTERKTRRKFVESFKLSKLNRDCGKIVCVEGKESCPKLGKKIQALRQSFDSEPRQSFQFSCYNMFMNNGGGKSFYNSSEKQKFRSCLKREKIELIFSLVLRLL